jgi:hypothetical protein
MSDSSSGDQSANSTGGESAAPHAADLPQVESPGLSPDQPEAFAAKAATAEPDRSADGASNPTGGTALVPTRAQPKAATPETAPDPSKSSSPSAPLPGFRALAAMMACAAALGGLAGSLATAGISYLMASSSPAPSYYSAFAEALGRLDHELTLLKAGIGSATASSEQVARIAERMDRTEKAQAEAGTKLARATDALDRMERRLAASPTNSPGDITGAIAEPRAAAGAAMSGDGKRAVPAAGATMPIVEGWVLRDVYRGAAMIQGRAGIIEVVPGDHLPALGRIEAVQRHDGRWVVVTSRGLIVSR